MTPSSKVLGKEALILHCVRFHTGRDRYVKYTVLQYKRSKSSQPANKLESRRADPLPTVLLLYHPQVTPFISNHSRTATPHCCIKP